MQAIDTSGFGGFDASKKVVKKKKFVRKKAPPKALAERLSKQKPRGDELRKKLIQSGKMQMQSHSKKENISVQGQSGTGEVPKRGAVRFNPVTGKMVAVTEQDTAGMVRDGAMMLPEKYLRAAAEAGLGSQNGMYSHMGALTKEMGRAKAAKAYSHSGKGSIGNGDLGGNMHGARGAGRRSGGPKPPKGRSVTVQQTAGGSTIAGFGSSGSGHGCKGHMKTNSYMAKQEKKGSNIRHSVQGRSRSIKSKKSDSGSSAYQNQKGVISGIHGCTSTKSQAFAEKKSTQSIGGGVKKSKPRRQGVTKRLGGSSAGAGETNDRDSMRAARLAALEKRGLA